MRPPDLRRVPFLFAAFLCAALSLPAQTANKPAQPAPANAQQTTGPTYNLQMSVPLVIEDIIALDGNGVPVHGLKRSDLTVTEDGKPVTIRYFEERTAPATPPAPAKPLDLGPDVFTNLESRTDTGPLNVLLLDTLNTSITDQAYVRQQMLKYITTLPPGMRIAIFGLGSQLYLLQGFTSDPAVLKEVIANKNKPHGSPLLANPVSTAPMPQTSDMMSDAFGSNPDPAEAAMIANMQQFEADQAAETTRMRMLYTLQAMNQLARYLAPLPGRKNLIWFSGSFPLYALPDENAQDPFRNVQDFSDDVRKTTELLARGRVAVYPIDGRGLFTNPALDASQSGSSFSRPGNGRGSFNATLRQFDQQTSSEHATMDTIAEQTGGKAFYNTNGLKEAVEKAVNYGDNYYTIAYTPSQSTWNGAYRKVSVKVDQPGMHLSYRKGYFADDPSAAKNGTKIFPRTAMQTVMLRGGPNAAQILFDVMVVPEDKTEEKLLDGTRANLKWMKAPFRSYSVQYLVDLHSVQLPTGGDGVHHGAIEVETLIYTADGQLVNGAGSKINVTLPAEKYEDLLKNGMRAHQTIQAPAKGEYFLRIGFHDPTSDRVGALEVPLTGLKSRQAVADALKTAPGAKPQ